MSFIRYAKLEGGQILDARGAVAPIKQASLARFSEFNEYRTSDNYLYLRVRAISSRTNFNHDGWPSSQLAGGEDVLRQHLAASQDYIVIGSNRNHKYGYSSFENRPIFVDHNNQTPSRARGVVVDSRLHVHNAKEASQIDPYYANAPDYYLPPTHVELLLEIDAQTFPKLAKALIDGSKDPHTGIDGFSMGANVGWTQCSLPWCGKIAHEEHEMCDHVKHMKGAQFTGMNPKTGKRETWPCYEICYEPNFFELSAVFSPADPSALTRELISSIQNEGQNKVASNWNRIMKGAIQPPMNPMRKCPSCGVGTLDPDHGMTCTSCGFSESGKVAAGMDPDPNAMGEERYIEAPCPQCKGIGMIGQDDCPYCGGDGMLNSGMYAMPRGDITGLTGRNPEDYPPMPQPLQDQLYNIPQHQGSFMKGSPEPGDDAYFGGKPGAAKEAYDAMVKEYGKEKGESVFFATRNKHKGKGSSKIAENSLPQTDLLSVPEKVDTLRKEMVCPVCGTSMDKGSKCQTCSYAPSPDSLDNPDLAKAREQSQQNMAPDGTHIEGYPDNLEQARTPPPRQVAPNFQSSASIINDMDWTFYHPKLGMGKLAGKINPVERPVLPTGPPATNEPNETIVTQPSGPVTNRTAASMIAAVKQKENNMTNMVQAADHQTLPAAADADSQQELLGVGGFMDATNEGASKAQAQVNLLDVGGTPVTDVGADHDSMQDAAPESDDSGFNTDMTSDDSGPTMVWDLNYSDSAVETQETPITHETLEGDEGVKKSALDAEPFPSDGGPDLAGGGANQGTQPVDSVGKAMDRVDVLDAVTTPSNNSGPTITWTGTDGNSYSRQQEPVTNETLEGSDGVKRSSFMHFVNASRLADMEIDMGVLTQADKYNRLAALAQTDPQILEAQLQTLAKVKTAGLRKTPSVVRTASTRLPAFNKTGSAVSAPSVVLDESLYL